MTAITVYVVTQHDTDENSHFVDGVYTTQQSALNSVVNWFNDERLEAGHEGVQFEELEATQFSDGLVRVSDLAFEDLVFSITRVAVYEGS